MGNKVLCVTGVIDTELWNKARWRGTAVLSDGQSAPYLGLLFEDREAAIKIFEQWNRDFGHKDIYEEIRIYNRRRYSRRGTWIYSSYYNQSREFSIKV